MKVFLKRNLFGVNPALFLIYSVKKTGLDFIHPACHSAHRNSFVKPQNDNSINC